MRHLTIAALPFVIACGEPLAPAIDVDAVSVRFDVNASMCSRQLFQDFESRIVGGAANITIAAIYGAPNGGYALSAEIETPQRGQLVVTIVGDNGGGITVPICHTYSLALGGVPAGGYHVLVKHADRSLNSSATALAARVRVW